MSARLENLVHKSLSNSDPTSIPLMDSEHGWDNRTISVRQIEKLTHLIFIGTKITADGKVEFKSDGQKMMFFDMKNKVRNMKSDVKVLFSTDSYSSNHETMAAVMREPETRRVWVDAISSFIIEQQLDGVELYYKWPQLKEDKENYVSFIRELRFKLDVLEITFRRQVDFIISVLTPHTGWELDSETILPDLMNIVDIFNVETDNFYSPTHTRGITGPLSPLLSANSEKSVDKVMKNGTYFENVKNVWNASDPLYRLVDLVDGKTQGNLLPWRKYQRIAFDDRYFIFDEESKTNYIWDEKNRKLHTFEDRRSLTEKMNYAVSRNLGGLAMRQLEYDDDTFNLLKAVTSIEICSEPEFGIDEVKYDCDSK